MLYKRIDAHVHTAFDSALLKESAKISGVEYSLKGLKRELGKNDVRYALSMGLRSRDYALLDPEAETPIIDSTLDNDIILIGGINPYKVEERKLCEVERALSSKRIRGSFNCP